MKNPRAIGILAITVIATCVVRTSSEDDPLTQARKVRVEGIISRNGLPPHVADELRKKMVPPIATPNWAEQPRLRALYEQAKEHNRTNTFAPGESPSEKLARAQDLETYDTNKDGIVTDEERFAVKRSRLLVRRAEYLKEQTEGFRKRFGEAAFSKFDSDKDGVFSNVEFLNASHAIDHAARTRAQQILARYDENSNGALDPTEDAKMQADLKSGAWDPGEWVLISAFE